MRLVKLLILSMAMSIALPGMAQLAQNNAQAYYKNFKEFFKDDICTELKSPYAEMTDDELKAELALDNTPEELVEIALKIKNNDWAEREKEFRIASYKPCSDPVSWSTYLKTMKYGLLSNPTGISADKDTLLIFVGQELPDSIWITLQPVVDNMPFGFGSTTLMKGLNFVKVSDSDNYQSFFIEYQVDTDTTTASKRLSDYPAIPIHIEGGEAFGYFDVNRHTDEDWKEMLKNDSHYMQVKGNRVLYHMKRSCFATACPNTITDAIRWWDRCVSWQHELMGVEKYYDRWNNLLVARDGDGPNMSATDYYTHYPDYNLSDILPWASVYASPGQMWGPAHEIGHVNQGAIQIVSTTEASNNLFSNVQLFRTGKTTTRGSGVANCANDFNGKIPFPLRGDVIGKSRMFYQLFLYFDAAGKDKTFYPRLFEALRQDPLVKGYYTSGKDDQLKFAEKCCEVAQMDLSEFFEAWGFFEPMQEANVGDYGTFLVTLAKEEIEESRERMQQYPKKGGHLMFIEDRIKPSERTDGVEGNRLDFNEEYAIGKMGSTGQWGDYIDESVKAEGYYYTDENGTIEIKSGSNARGALGFKVYNAGTNRLLAFSNSYSVKIPTYAKYYEIRVVASQADGTDVEVPSAALSDNEEWQKTALEALLVSVNDILQRTTTDGSQLGRFYKDAVKELSDVYQKAKAAVNNNDTSEHTYKEWSSILNGELEKLKNNTSARAYFEELDVYNIINVKNRGYYMCDMQYGIEAVYNLKTLEDKAQKSWMIEHADDEGYFYIKNKAGKYINGIELSGAYCGGTSTADAVMFKAHYLNNGNIYFTIKGSDKFLTVNSEYKIVATDALSDYSLWNVVVEEKNSTAIEDIWEENEDCGILYDLLGRRVAEPGKGVYIKNGKKIVIR